MKKKNVKKVLAGAAFVALSGVAGVAKYAHDKHKEDVHNDELNTEWKTEFEDADSVYADAKTTHFYARKNLSPEAVEALKKEKADLQKEDELEKQISQEKVAKQVDSWGEPVDISESVGLLKATTDRLKRMKEIDKKLKSGHEYEVEVDGYDVEPHKSPVVGECWHEGVIIEVEDGQVKGFSALHSAPDKCKFDEEIPQTGEHVKKLLKRNSQKRAMGRKFKSIKDKLFDR